MKPMPTSGKTITRVELSDAVYRTKAGLTRTESAALVDCVLDEITDAIARREMVKLSLFGTFTVRMKGQRIGRNPKTGVEAPIAPRRVVLFKASAIMKRKIENNSKPDTRYETTGSNLRFIAAEPAQ
jgi:integration host factor subunit alpha